MKRKFVLSVPNISCGGLIGNGEAGGHICYGPSGDAGGSTDLAGEAFCKFALQL
jgi:hypothetical protein